MVIVARLLMSSLLVLFSFCVHADATQDKAIQTLQQYMPRLATPAVIDAIRRSNEKNKFLSEAEIIALDKAWRAEDKSVIGPIANNRISKYLMQLQGLSNDLITEIILMDNRGLNVAYSKKTSDYWQGDEAKFTKTFQMGPDAVHVGELSADESTQQLQIQVSGTIVDEMKQPIGAVTLGLNVHKL